ncbi:MAG: hypothetical protein B6244_03400 [Candidatus Cloacimonetes bacterium 4572_55]|nr:MAG: hypothetical protein B6244_03400 [Candidatus Cloacimonetes bacterium 4572_55]
MTRYESIIQSGRETAQIEMSAIKRLVDQIGDEFARAVEMIAENSGRVIVTGIGKSGIIGKKIAATMTSLGTAAFFMHPSEGIHGDLGLVSEKEMIIAISKSGKTAELNHLIPLFRHYGCRIIAMTGNLDSQLARIADVTLHIDIEKEACPFDLAPTSSTTAALVMGDALAIALLKEKNFRLSDFARNHPGGVIGKSLLRVGDLMHTGDEVPIVQHDARMRDALLEMTGKRLGMTAVVDPSGCLTGVITDGDLRRWLCLESADPDRPADSIMTRNPKAVDKKIPAREAMKIMEQHAITVLVVTDSGNSNEIRKRPIGVIHLHDLVKSGIRYTGKGYAE